MGGLARVWSALAGLVAGVLCAESLAAMPVGLVAAGGIGMSLRRRGAARVAGLVAVSFAFGAVDAAIRSPERQPLAGLARSVPSCDLSGRTLEEAGGLGLLVAVDVAECTEGAPVLDAGAAFVDDFELAPGRRFRASGWLIPLGDEPFDRARSRAGAAVSFRVVEGTDAGGLPGLHALAVRVRTGLAGATGSLGASGALLRGLAIGDTAGIDGTTEDTLRRSGLAHLLAVSGSNVALLLGLVALVLRRTSLATRVVSCAVALVLFVAVVGPDSSVLRAAGMGVVAIVAIAAGRRAEPLHALGLALVALVALRPGIVYSAGLHLSVAATLGIVLWAAPVAERLHRFPRPVALAAGATFAAQVAVTPLLAGVFGSVPLGGLPANLLALPAVAPATVLGLAAGAAAPWSEGLGSGVAALAAPFAGWILRVGEAFGGPGWALTTPNAWGPIAAAPVVVAAAFRIAKLSRPPRKLEP